MGNHNPPHVESHNFLHSYCLYPGVKFETQAIGEEIVLVLRAHPITQLSWIVNTFLFVLILIGVNFFLPNLLILRQIIFFNLFFAVMIFTYVWINFLNWFFNVGIITNKRIIDMDYYYIIYREFTEVDLDKIEDMTTKVGGYFETFFNYGDLFVQTAATIGNVEFLNIPNPAGTIKIIDSLTNK